MHSSHANCTECLSRVSSAFLSRDRIAHLSCVRSAYFSRPRLNSVDLTAMCDCYVAVLHICHVVRNFPMTELLASDCKQHCFKLGGLIDILHSALHTCTVHSAHLPCDRPANMSLNVTQIYGFGGT